MDAAICYVEGGGVDKEWMVEGKLLFCWLVRKVTRMMDEEEEEWGRMSKGPSEDQRPQHSSPEAYLGNREMERCDVEKEGEKDF